MDKIKVAILFIILMIVGATMVFVIMEKQSEEVITYTVAKKLQPYMLERKNDELSSTEFKLNGSNKEMYYYFDLINFNDETKEYNEMELIPFVKIYLNNPQENVATNENGEVIENPENQKNIEEYQKLQNLIKVNLYSIKDLNQPIEGDNIEEITTFGEEGTEFQGYYQCKNLKVYDKKNETENTMHYVAKISLNVDTQEYADFTGTSIQDIKFLFGYKQF